MEFSRDLLTVTALMQFGNKSQIRSKFKTKWDKVRLTKVAREMKAKNVESKITPLTTRTVKTRMLQEAVVANTMNIRPQPTE